MNKMTLFLAAATLTMTSCGNSAQKEQDARIADSIAEQHRLDSIAQVEQESQFEAARQDSISEAMYADAITLTKGKQRISETNPPTEAFNISLPVTITNNTDTELLPEDYQITYCDRVEYSDGSGHEDTPKSATGPKLAPGESATITLSAKYVTDIAKVKTKMQLPLEEFKARRNNAK